MTSDETDVAARLAEALLTKWKREYEEETSGLPATVDPEFLSPVTDTSHGDLALEYAAALLPVVRELQAEAVRPFEELFAGGPDTPCRSFDAASVLREIREDVRRLLAERPDDDELRHRVDRTYGELRKHLHELGAHELAHALGDPGDATTETCRP